MKTELIPLGLQYYPTSRKEGFEQMGLVNSGLRTVQIKLHDKLSELLEKQRSGVESIPIDEVVSLVCDVEIPLSHNGWLNFKVYRFLKGELNTAEPEGELK